MASPTTSIIESGSGAAGGLNGTNNWALMVGAAAGNATARRNGSGGVTTDGASPYEGARRTDLLGIAEWEAYCDLVSAPPDGSEWVGFYLRMDTAGNNGYELYLKKTAAGGDTVFIDEITSGAFTNRATDSSVEWVSGNKFFGRIRTVGATAVCEIFRHDGSAWESTVRCTWTDSASPYASGMMMLEIQEAATARAVISNIGGGAAVSTTYARPDADVTDGGWTNELGTNTNLYASIDEAVASDADFIESGDSPATADVAEIGLTAITL